MVRLGQASVGWVRRRKYEVSVVKNDCPPVAKGRNAAVYRPACGLNPAICGRILAAVGLPSLEGCGPVSRAIAQRPLKGSLVTGLSKKCYGNSSIHGPPLSHWECISFNSPLPLRIARKF